MAGVTGFVSALSSLTGLFGSTLVDRLGFKRVSILADMMSGAVIACVPLLYYGVGLAFWQLLLLVFLRAIFNTPGNTARQSLLPDLIKLAEIRREGANAVYQAIVNGTQLAGPVLVGLLIPILGTTNVLWVDAASFAMSAGLIAFTVPSPIKKNSVSARWTWKRYRFELMEGVRFVRYDRLLYSLTITATLVNFIGSALGAVVLPVYARQIFGTALSLGLMFAGLGGGTLAGSLLYGAFGPQLPRRGIFVGGMILLGIPFWILALTPSLTIAVVALVLVGLATGPLVPLISTIFQERVPESLRGRVFGTVGAFGSIATPLGVLLAGYLLESINLNNIMIGIAVFLLAVSVWVAASQSFHAMTSPLTMEEPADKDL